MKPFDAQIENIVTEVVRRLRAAGTVTPSTSGTARGNGLLAPQAERPTTRGASRGGVPTNGRRDSAASTATPGDLPLYEKVVTLATLEGRLKGVHRVVVRPEAVVTPAVRDELRDKGVGIVHGPSHVDGEACTPSDVPLILAAAGQSEAVAKAVQSVRARLGGQTVAETGFTEALRELTARVTSGGALGVVITDRPAAAACVANRVRGIRAAAAHDVASVKAAVDELAANVLVVRAAVMRSGEMIEVVRLFLAAGPRTCPPELSSALERMA